MRTHEGRGGRRFGFALIVALVLGLILAPVKPALATVSRGDVNGDGMVNIADPIALLTSLFGAGPPPVPCRSGVGSTADVNADGVADIADVIYLLNVLFGAPAPPLPPGPC